MKKSNRLINEKSPYLLQHAYNPVNWYPWGEEAFQRADKEDKPIFLSIDYSTCHWCHVMEKESFEDEEVAKLMNEVFISIKVDREERPDIDGIYMSVCQMLTGGGGWPLTIIMTPEKKPFFTGTYFPKYNRFNRIGMMELIPRISEVWNSKKNEIIDSANEITSSLKNQNSNLEIVEVDESILDKAYNDLSNRFDEMNGGFGSAPKFPSPHTLLFLLRYSKRNKDSNALKMVEQTLTQMRLGGIYDHIGFGFARYSTDKHWLVPHFEKMLYDQAMMILAYTEAYLVTKNEFYKKTAEEIIEYVLRDMTHPEGGFYSAEDADSEGEEGKFYLWNTNEIRDILSKHEFDIAVKVFNISDSGNWRDESKGTLHGTNILHLTKKTDKLAEGLSISTNELNKKLETIRLKLFTHRENRVHPHKDDKILTDWNGLMISALAKASQAFNNTSYSEAAEKAYTFIETNLTEIDGRLLHRFRDGQSGIQANIDDYAFLLNALIDLYETTFDIKYLKRAIHLNEISLNEFWDNIAGGFYFTSISSEKLITRQKDVYDGAIPSGNSLALLNLIRLAKFTGNAEFYNKSQKIIECFSSYILRSPSAFSMFMCGLDFLYSDSMELVIISDNINEQVKKAVEVIRSIYNPNKIVTLIFDNKYEDYTSLLPFTKNMIKIGDGTTFYVCRNYICNQPVKSISELEKLIN